MALAVPALAAGHSGAVAGEADFSERPGTLRVALDAPVEEVGLAARTDVGGITAGTEIRRDPVDPAALVISLSELTPARQIVEWTALSTDGHVASGSAEVSAPPGLGRFGQVRPIRVGDDPDDPLLTAGRGLALVGLLVALGLVALEILVLLPSWREGGVRAPGSALAAEEVRRAVGGPLLAGRRRWWRVWWAAIGFALVGLAFWVVALRDALGISMADLLGDTRVGSALLAVAAGLAVAGASAGIASRGEPRPGPIGIPFAVGLGAPLAVALGAISWGGHAATGPEPGLDITVDLVHSIATAAWVGGLVGLVLLLRGALARTDGRARTSFTASVVVHFSAMAIAAVATVTVTGIYRALAEIATVSDLWDTGYGRWLAVKIVVFAVMLGLAVVNRFLLHVRLERAALGLSADDRGATAALGRSVRAELVLATALLAAVALLIATAPTA